MADCQVSDVIAKAIAVLGDELGQITQGIFDDYGTSYLDVINLLNKISAPEITRETYYTVPANTTVLFPSLLGVTDFAEPQKLEERGNVSSAAVTSVTGTYPVTVTFPGPVPAAPQIELSGVANVPSWINRDWYITVTGSNTATLNGAVMPTGFSGTGGSASWSVDTFVLMYDRDYEPFAGPNVARDVLGYWNWQNGKIYFPAASTPRQIWIQYLASPVAPASGPIGLCGGRELNFLAYGTAARFAPKRNMPQGPQLASWAYGPSGEADGSGGMLRDLINPIMLQNQGVQRRSKLFRRRRGVLVPF